jgi:FHA domain
VSSYRPGGAIRPVLTASAGIFTVRSAVADVGYVPGSLTAVAGDSCLALVEAAPDSPAAAWIWQQVGRGASAQALLAGLLGAGFEGVGGFTLLDQPAAGPLRLFCRGAVGATVVGGSAVDGTAAEGTQAAVAASARIDGVGLLTWREHLVPPDAERIYLGRRPDDGALWLPAAAGVLLAGCVIVDLAKATPPATAPPATAPPATAPPAAVPSAAGRPAAVPSSTAPPAAGSSAAVPPATAPPATASPSTAPPAAARPYVRAAGSPEGGRSGVDGSRVGSPSVGSPVAGDSHAGGSGAGSAAQASPDAGAAVAASAQRDAAEAADRSGKPDARPSEPGGWFQPSGAPHGQDAPSSAPPIGGPWEPRIGGSWEPPSGSPNGIRSAALPPDGEPAPSAHEMPTRLVPPSAVAGGTEEDGLTVKRADPVARPESPSDKTGPEVPALICPAGHVNPPSETACRHCGAALPPDPVIVPRPVLGVLRLSTGDVVALDRDVVLGRNPPADLSEPNGEDGPQVVRLPSADGQISRAHLRITLSGWRVLVTDLNSTNGTRITPPGRDPEQLPPGAPVPMTPGTVVALAEGVDFRFEAPD